MKRLRILSGRHAGAAQELAPGECRLGQGQDCDIAISDWEGPPLHLTVGTDDVTACWHAAGSAEHTTPADREPISLIDLCPQRLGGVMLCVGPAYVAWPSDATLLDSNARRPAEAHARPGMPWLRGLRRDLLAIFGVVAVAGAAWVVLSAYAAPLPPTLEASRAAVQRAVDEVSAGRLAVRTEGRALVVSGLVDSVESAAAMRRAIDLSRGPHGVLPRYAIVTEVVEAIRGSVGLPNASIKHLGDGVFSYTAETADTKAARLALDRVSAELTPTVRRIEASLEHIGAADSTPMLSRLTTDGLSVVQTRDGVKHMVVRSAPNSPVTVGEVLSLPPPLSAPSIKPAPIKE
jgi:type III secretion protein D